MRSTIKQRLIQARQRQNRPFIHWNLAACFFFCLFLAILMALLTRLIGFLLSVAVTTAVWLAGAACWAAICRRLKD